MNTDRKPVRAVANSILAALLAALTAAPSAHASEITSVTPSTITLGSVVTITGSGFVDPAQADGGKPRLPRVFGLTDGSKKRLRIKVIAASGTSITARVRKIPGSWKQPSGGTSWTLQVVPRGKNAGGASSLDAALVVVGPVVDGVTPGLAHGRDEITLEVSNAGSGRLKAWIGDRRVKLVRTDRRSESRNVTTFTARVPKSMPEGIRDIKVRSRMGEHSLPKALTVIGAPDTAAWLVLNGNNYPGDKGTSLTITVTSDGVDIQASRVMGWGKHGPYWPSSQDDYSIGFPFDPALLVAPVRFTGPPNDSANIDNTVWLFDISSPNPTPAYFTGADFQITVDHCVDGRILGHFEGTLTGILDFFVEGSFGAPHPDC